MTLMKYQTTFGTADSAYRIGKFQAYPGTDQVGLDIGRSLFKYLTD